MGQQLAHALGRVGVVLGHQRLDGSLDQSLAPRRREVAQREPGPQGEASGVVRSQESAPTAPATSAVSWPSPNRGRSPGLGAAPWPGLGGPGQRRPTQGTALSPARAGDGHTPGCQRCRTCPRPKIILWTDAPARARPYHSSRTPDGSRLERWAWQKLHDLVSTSQH